MVELPDNLKDEFFRGIDEFNSRKFFDCHETLEDVWREYLETDRELIQGIIQIAVAYYHLGRDNQLGAKKLFARGLPRVKKYGSNHFGLRLDNFVHKVEEDSFALESESGLIEKQFHIPIITIIGSENDCS